MWPPHPAQQDIVSAKTDIMKEMIRHAIVIK
jgi:hypothetical protein